MEYIEIRSIDLNPFLPGGIDVSDVQFLELLLLGCLFSDSAPLSRSEFLKLATTQNEVITNGRDLNLPVEDNLNIKQAGHRLLDSLLPLAELLDSYGEKGYMHALTEQRAKFDDAPLTPSGRILEAMDHNNLSFFGFVMEQSKIQHDFFKGNILPKELLTQFSEDAKNSMRAQEAVEANDTESFDVFLERYFSS